MMGYDDDDDDVDDDDASVWPPGIETSSTQNE